MFGWNLCRARLSSLLSAPSMRTRLPLAQQPRTAQQSFLSTTMMTQLEFRPPLMRSGFASSSSKDQHSDDDDDENSDEKYQSTDDEAEDSDGDGGDDDGEGRGRKRKNAKAEVAVVEEANPSVLEAEQARQRELDLDMDMVRTQQLLEAAREMVRQEQWDMAETQLENVAELCGNLTEAGRGSQVEQRIDGAEVAALLGFSRLAKGNLELAAMDYQKAIALLRHQGNHEELGAALQNYAEVLAFSRRVEEAVEVSKECVEFRVKVHGDDSEITAGARANLASYLATLERFEEARKPSAQALATLEAQMGRENGFTLGALRNHYKILEGLQLQGECEALRKDWAEHPSSFEFEIGEADVAQADETMSRITESWVPVRKAFDPEGFIKSQEYQEEEFNAFVDKWEKEGLLLPPGMASLMQSELAKAYAGKSLASFGDAQEVSFPDLENPGDASSMLEEDAAIQKEFESAEQDFLNVGFKIDTDRYGKPISMTPVDQQIKK